jgi:putative transposase
MVFKPNSIYHLHNKTFNGTLAFTTRANYRFFIEKLSELRGACELISFCLMPDRFDLILYVPEDSVGICRTSNDQMQVLSRRIGSLLSSYVRAHNRQQGRRGSLFQPKTKSSQINGRVSEYSDYVHQKPVRAGLVFRVDDWEFSSYCEYRGKANGICNTTLGRQIWGF